MKKQSAFTLAEVLITLMIAGIVASMTIPGLLQDWQNKDLKTRWKKTFAELASVDQRIRDDNGGDLSEYFDGVTVNKAAPLRNQYKNYLSSAKPCPNGGVYCTNPSIPLGASQSPSQYKTLDGSFLIMDNISCGQILLNNGTHLFFNLYNPEASLIWADVNGFDKGPNTLGKDMFGAVIKKDSFKPLGYWPNTGNCTNTPATCAHMQNGFNGTPCAGAGCSMQYLQE